MQATGYFAVHSSSYGESHSARPDYLIAHSFRVQGYPVFLSGNWNTATFIFNYGIVSVFLTIKVPVRETDMCKIALAGSIGLGWKLFKKTRFHRASEVDLVSHLYFFDALTEHYRHEREVAPQNLKDKILAKIF